MASIIRKWLVLDYRTRQVNCHGLCYREMAGTGLYYKASQLPWPLLKGNGWYWTLEQGHKLTWPLSSGNGWYWTLGQGKSTGMTSITGKWMQGWEFAHRFFELITRFYEQKSNLLVKKRKLLPLLFYHECPEQIAHCGSFVKSNDSNLLTVALLLKANCSRHS